MQRSSFRFYVSQPSRRISRRLPTGELAEYKLINTNALLGVNAIDGVKTGTTSKAGECVIISAARPPKSVQNPDGSHTITPRRLIVVVLGAADRFGLAERLLARGWTIYDSQQAGGTPATRADRG
jgi:D-alanyl-D-alanine carboxypeptidase